MDEPYRYRNPDGSIRLDEALGERYVRHYTRILASSNEEFAAMQLSMAVLPDADEGPAPGSWLPARPEMTWDGWSVVPEGVPDRAASSCTDLAVLPEVCWDVCGYYRALGLHWRATRAQIVRAAVDLDPGRHDRRVAYATSQLLDPVIRRAYDMMPQGGLFLGDRDVREQIERMAAMEASRRTAEAGQPVAQGQVLGEWGFDKGVPEEEARERLAGQFRAGDSPDALGSTLSSWERGWGWYRLADPYDDPYQDPPGDPAALEEWQALVAAALSARGIRMSFSVGTWPGPGPRQEWRDGNKPCIFFIGGPPTQQKADEAARGYLAQQKEKGTRGKRGSTCQY